MRELHFCTTFKQLTLACAMAMEKANKAHTTIVFVQDFSPLDEFQRGYIKRVLPGLDLVVIDDGEWERRFKELPSFFPEILRRNVRFFKDGHVVQFAHQWQPEELKGRQFDIGYLHNTVMFSAKIFRGICKCLIACEAGLNSYEEIRVKGLKRWIRKLKGLPPEYQVLGEEPWIERIWVEHPERLPNSVAQKGEKLSFDDVMAKLSPDQIRILSGIFENFDFKQPDSQIALLLSQPLEAIGMGSKSEKLALYGELAAVLMQAGYHTVIKFHPRESAFVVEGAQTLPAKMPSELVPHLFGRKFDVAVAICSNALAGEENTIASQTIQLVAPKQFNLEYYGRWKNTIVGDLETRLKQIKTV